MTLLRRHILEISHYINKNRTAASKFARGGFLYLGINYLRYSRIVARSFSVESMSGLMDLL